MSSPITANIKRRQDFVFVILIGVFLGTLAMLNILGISRFIDLSFSLFGLKIPMVLAIGVLPYPVTFLCTDLICEFYGQRKANYVVLSGLVVNCWIFFIFWLAGVLPGFETLDPQTNQIALDAAQRQPVFFEIRQLAFGAIFASMLAYLSAQFCDVYLFHFWKRLTKGKHLWLRNNGSTLISQLVDTTAVILITHYYAHALPIDSSRPISSQLMIFIFSGYVFKLVAALFDTIPLYICVHKLEKFLQIDPKKVH